MLKRTFLSATAVALMMATPVFAQSAGRSTDNPGQPSTMPPVAERPQAATQAPIGQVRNTILVAEKDSQIRTEKLVGMKVVNGKGEELGTVDDIVLNDNGTVSGLILRTGGVLGVGGKSVAIAWRDVAGAIHSDAINVQMTKDQIEKAPAFKTKEDQSDKASPLPMLPSSK